MILWNKLSIAIINATSPAHDDLAKVITKKTWPYNKKAALK
jgi:hypothetical protein